jgi:hypothetical protein
MTTTYETYSSACPRCGYPETIDAGPYEPSWTDAELGPPGPDIHLLWCGRCGKPFDAGPPEAAGRQQQWAESQHQIGRHQCCDPATCETARQLRDSHRRGAP